MPDVCLSNDNRNDLQRLLLCGYFPSLNIVLEPAEKNGAVVNQFSAHVYSVKKPMTSSLCVGRDAGLINQ
jgi:hypothetical protein